MLANKEQVLRTSIVMQTNEITDAGTVIRSSPLMTFILTEVHLANDVSRSSCAFRKPNGGIITLSVEQGTEAIKHITGLADLVQTLAIQHTPAEGTA